VFSSRSCTWLSSSSTLRWPVALKKVSTMRSRWRVALSPRSAIHSLSRVRASAGVAASGGRTRILDAGICGRMGIGYLRPRGTTVKLILKFNCSAVRPAVKPLLDPAPIAGKYAPLLLRARAGRAGSRVATCHAYERFASGLAHARVGIRETFDDGTRVPGRIVAIPGNLGGEGAQLRLRRGEIDHHVVAGRFGGRRESLARAGKQEHPDEGAEPDLEETGSGWILLRPDEREPVDGEDDEEDAEEDRRGARLPEAELPAADASTCPEGQECARDQERVEGRPQDAHEGQADAGAQPARIADFLQRLAHRDSVTRESRSVQGSARDG